MSKRPVKNRQIQNAIISWSAYVNRVQYEVRALFAHPSYIAYSKWIYQGVLRARFIIMQIIANN